MDKDVNAVMVILIVLCVVGLGVLVLLLYADAQDAPDPPDTGIGIFEDEHVTCWFNSNGISCIPNWLLTPVP